MDAELAKMLDAAGLTADQRTAAEAAFSIDSLGKVLKDGTMMRSDYSRKMDELKARQATLEANWDKANKEFIEMQTDLDSTKAEKEDAARKLKEAEDKLAAAAAAPKPEPIDTSKFLTLEQMAEREKKLAAGMTAFSAEAMDVRETIRSITGSDVSYKKVLMESQAAGKTPGEWAEETYQLTTKQAEKAAADRQKEIQEAEQRGYAKAASEAANPALRPLAASKDPFYTPKPGADGEVQNPWDMTEPAADEVALLTELQNAAGR